MTDRYEPDPKDADDRKRMRLTDTAAQTLAVVKLGRAIAEASDAAVAGTRVVLDAAPLVAKAPRGRASRIEVTAERTGQCARRLVVEDGCRRVAMLNFANGVRIGGGFLHGARAQEEDLCRCSALYPCIASQNAQAFYVENHCTGSALVSDALIVSSLVPFFRDDTSPSLAFLDAPFLATVITAAAPDRGWLTAQVESQLVKPVSDDDIAALFVRRAKAIIAAAHDDGADALILGAWGCGAFGNDPVVVAAAFAQALDEIGACVPRVVFAVWPEHKPNYAVFRARFG